MYKTRLKKYFIFYVTLQKNKIIKLLVIQLEYFKITITTTIGLNNMMKKQEKTKKN